MCIVKPSHHVTINIHMHFSSWQYTVKMGCACVVCWAGSICACPLKGKYRHPTIDVFPTNPGASQTAMRGLAGRGKLVEINLMELQGVQPTSGMWSPSGHVLLQVVKVRARGRRDWVQACSFLPQGANTSSCVCLQ